MRFSVLLAGRATLAVISSPVLADSQSDLEQCKFVGEISNAIEASRRATASSMTPR